MKDTIENLHSETFKQFNELKNNKQLKEPTSDIKTVDIRLVDVRDERIGDCDIDDFSGTESDENDDYQSETSSPVFDRDSGFDDKSKQTDTSPDHSNLFTSPRRAVST